MAYLVIYGYCAGISEEYPTLLAAITRGLEITAKPPHEKHWIPPSISGTDCDIGWCGLSEEEADRIEEAGLTVHGPRP